MHFRRTIVAAFSLLALFVWHCGEAAYATTAAIPRFEKSACPPKLKALASSRCGFLIVPENRTKPHSRTIRVAVAIVPSRSAITSRYPLVYLGGGPGGVPFLEAPALISAGFNFGRELVLVQQRGTLYSEPALICPNIDVFNERLIGLSYDAPSTRRLHLAATRECRRQLATAGADLGAYNTTENAADFADLRRVLHYRAWDVYGVSYGTDLAQVYLRDHPDGIRSVIFDSTVPTPSASFSDFWTSAGLGLGALSRACAAQTACNKAYPNVAAAFARLVVNSERRPVTTHVKTPGSKTEKRVVLDGGALVNWFVAMSFFTPQFVDVPAWIARLSHGDAQRIAASRALVTPPGYVAYGLAFGVFCREFAPADSQQKVVIAGRRAFPTYPDSVLAQAPQVPFGFDDCRIWNVPAAPIAFRVPVSSSVPALIFSGSFDQVTGRNGAEAIAAHLSAARVVIIRGVGHFVLPESRCAQTIMASFLVRSNAPLDRCATSQPHPFRVF